MIHGETGAEVAARSRRAGDAMAKVAWLLGGILAFVNFFGLIAGFSLGTESAWFSEEVERFGWIAAIVLAALLVGGTIAWLAVNVGARKPMTWVMGVVFALVCTQLTLISGVMVTEALTLWLSGTPHREAAKFYSAGAVGGTGRSARCAQKIAVRPALSRFEGLIPSFCAPQAVVEPGLKRDDEIVLVGRASRLGFVVERVERAR